jgi:hypothetical protein
MLAHVQIHSNFNGVTETVKCGNPEIVGAKAKWQIVF